LCSTHFAAQKPSCMVVANRTRERAETLASQFDGKTMKLADLPERLAEFDIVVSCTASSLPILGLGLVQKASKARRHMPMVMIDLAVPRDIEPEVSQLDDVYLYSVDDLGRYVQMASDSRQAAVVQAEAIIDSRVQNFMHWMDSRAVVPVIRNLNQGADAIVQTELDRARRLLARGENADLVLEQFARSLTQKYLHAPMVALNRSQGDDRAALMDMLPRLFPYQDSSH
ncbi:MAG: glutamyl-tRNA reductase, partial [Advenella sp.]